MGRLSKIFVILAGFCLAGSAWAGVPHTIHLKPAWKASGELAGSAFGLRVMAGGDVYGDGYGDLVVGAPSWQGGRGKAYLYRGGPRGLSRSPAWSLEGGPGERLGDRVGQAGDVNADGHADIFISAPGWQKDLGRVLVFYGSSQGLKAAADWSVSPEKPGQMFGDCTHPTGDLYGDGFDSLAVGAFAFDRNRGRIALYRGSAQGLLAKPSWQAEGETPNDWYGYGIGAAGDVDGDGVADLLAGGKNHGEGGAQTGKVYLYKGSRAGLAKAPSWTWSGARPGGHAGVRLAVAGDLNGDGTSDVLVTSVPDGGENGRLYIFFGGPHGLAAKPDQEIAPPVKGLQYFGEGACPLGDILGEGFDAVAVSGRDALGRGRVYVYRGSAKGLASRPTWEIDGEGMGDRFGWWVAPAGDVDGDGLGDLAIGAESAGPGKIYVVYGRQFKASLTQAVGVRGAAPRLGGYLPQKRFKAKAQ